MQKRNKELTLPSSIKSLEPIKTRKGRAVYADNPFLETFSIQIGQKSITFAAGLTAVDQEGEKVNAAAISTFATVDTEEFIKLYVKNINYIFGLSQTAQKVLSPLMYVIQKTAVGVAHVFFSYNESCEACKNLNIKEISRTIYTRGIKELIDAGFLAENSKGISWYWINPNIIFNGDRIRFIQEYRLKRKEQRALQYQEFI